MCDDTSNSRSLHHHSKYTSVDETTVPCSPTVASVISSTMGLIRLPRVGVHEEGASYVGTKIHISQSCRSGKSSPMHLTSEASMEAIKPSFLLSPDSKMDHFVNDASEHSSPSHLLSFIPESECLSPISGHPHSLSTIDQTTVPVFTSPDWPSSTLTSATMLSLATSAVTFVDHDLASLSDCQKKSLSLFLDSSDDEDDHHDEDMELEQIYNSSRVPPKTRTLQMRPSRVDPFESINDVSF
jgi:hypothetical protein